MQEQRFSMEESKKSPESFMAGTVVSDKMDKTVVVKTERTYKHPRFGKTMRVSKKYKVHDERGEAKIGDTVEIYTGRPIAKTKYMYLERVIKPHAAHN